MDEFQRPAMASGVIPATWIPGVPRPQGSKKAIMGKHQKFPSVVESSPHVATWRSDIQSAVSRVYDGRPLIGPVIVAAVFIFPRPLAHYVGGDRERGRLKWASPRYHTQDPDLDKVLRAVLDALTGYAWSDDNRVALFSPAVKIWGPTGGLWFTFAAAQS